MMGLRQRQGSTRARGYKTFFKLSSAEHENLKTHKYENIMKFSTYLAQKNLECYFFLLSNVKMPTVGSAELSMKEVL